MDLSNRQQERGSLLILLILVSILGYGTYLTIFGGRNLAAVGAMLIAAVGLPWYLSFQFGRFELFEPIIYHTIFGCMLAVLWIDRALISQTPFRYEAITMSFENGYLLAGGALIAMLLGTVVGYYLFAPPIGRRFSAIGTQFTRSLYLADRVSGDTFRLVGGAYMVAGVIGLTSIILLIYPGDEILYMFTSTDNRSEIFAGNGPLVFISRSLYIGYFLWLCGAVVDNRSPSLLEVLLVAPVTGGFLLLGGRGQSLSIVVVTTMFLYYTIIEDIFKTDNGAFMKLTEYIPPPVLVLFIPIIGVSMAVVVVVLRGVRLSQSVGESLASVDPVAIMSAGVNEDIFDNFLALVEIVPEQLGFQYGTFYIRVVLNFIPRALWPEKPVATSGGVLRRIVEPDGSGGRPPGAMGDYYLNFGLPGIPLLGALYGVILYLAWRLIRGRYVSTLSLTIFSLIVANIGRSGLTNNVLTGLFQDLLIIAPAIVFLTWVGSRRRRRVHSPML